MQEMAPGRRVALHAGHWAAVGWAAWGGGGVTRLSAEGFPGAPLGGAAAPPGRGPPAGLPVPTPAAAGSRVGAVRTVKTFLHAGHRTCLPPASSATWRVLLQCGHRVTWDMDQSRFENQPRAPPGPFRFRPV